MQNTHDIYEYMAKVYRQRRIVAESDWRANAVLCCYDYEVENAIRWYEDAYKKPPAYIVTNSTVNGVGQNTSIPLLSLSELRTRSDLLCIVYGDNPRAKCIELATFGVHDVVFSHDPKLPTNKFDHAFYTQNMPLVQKAFSLLEDEESRFAYASAIKYRMIGEHGYLYMADYPEYNHPLVHAEKGDWVIDGGAFDGGTSLSYLSQVGESGNIFAFEADPESIQKIKTKLAGLSGGMRDAIVLLEHALSDRTKTLCFSALGTGSSRAVESGGIEVSAMSIDDLSLERCDLISLDVEGAETDVLKGAVNTLTRFRPKLQISIYHTPSDIFSLPLLIADMLDNYVYFVGHHDAYHVETDLYAIPRERLKRG